MQIQNNRRGRITKTCRYSVKGVQGKELLYLDIKEGVGVVGDRRYAVRAKGRPSEEWKPKTFFRVSMTDEIIARQVPRFIGEDLDPEWVRELGIELGDEELTVLDTGGRYNMVDTNPLKYGPTVSFLNMATVRDMERRTGWIIDPRRFRMNAWFDNDDPWSELAWANDFPGTKEFVAGDVQYCIQDACERCEAINANPSTGERDLDLLTAIETALHDIGYAGSPHRKTFNVMGFLATPLMSGRLFPGQEIVIPQ